MRFGRRIRRRILRRALGLAFAGALLAAGSAGPAAAMPDDPCRLAACSVTLTVDEAPVRWNSVELFYPNNEDVVVTPSVAGRTLRLSSSGGVEGCRQSYRGMGLVATVRVCGTETPVRIRAKRRRPGMVDLVITYQAAPFMDGGVGAGL
jgi:hypothetical protein